MEPGEKKLHTGRKQYAVRSSAVLTAVHLEDVFVLRQDSHGSSTSIAGMPRRSRTIRLCRREPQGGNTQDPNNAAGRSFLI